MALIIIILSGIIAVCLFMHVEKTDDYVEKWWCFLIGVGFVIGSVFLFSRIIKENYYEEKYTERVNRTYNYY